MSHENAKFEEYGCSTVAILLVALWTDPER